MVFTFYLIEESPGSFVVHVHRRLYPQLIVFGLFNCELWIIDVLILLIREVSLY